MRLRALRHEPVIRSIVQRVSVAEKQVTLSLSTHGLAQAVGVERVQRADTAITLEVPVRLKRCGFGARFILPSDSTAVIQSKPDPSLIKAVVRAAGWFDRLSDGTVDGITALAETNGLSPSFFTRSLRLAFLAPDIAEAILDGKQPRALTIDRLVQRSAELPIDWSEQRKMLGFG